MIVWVIGLAVLITAMWVAWTQTPLNDFLPAGVALAVALVIVAVAIFALARSLDWVESGPVVLRRRRGGYRRVVEEDELPP